MPSWIRSVSVCPGTLGSTHRSCCRPGSVVLMVPHTEVVGSGVLDCMFCLIFFRIHLWTWQSWHFSPVPLHLMVPSVSTISGGKKFPNLSICHIKSALLLSAIKSLMFHRVPTLLVLRNQVNSVSVFTLLLPSCFVSLCHILPQPSPLQMQARLFSLSS